jgi:hypothetical protein
VSTHDKQAKAEPEGGSPLENDEGSLAFIKKHWRRMSPGERRAWFRKHLRTTEVPAAFFKKQRDAWMQTRNPYYIWQVIGDCIENGFDFPTWVDDYLAEAASRMMAPDSMHDHDLTKALPRIFGFEIKRGKRWLTPELAPDEALKREMVANLFAAMISAGGKPTDAVAFIRETTETIVLPEDDRTLLKWIKQHFGITQTPRTRTEWLAEINAWRHGRGAAPLRIDDRDQSTIKPTTALAGAEHGGQLRCCSIPYGKAL